MPLNDEIPEHLRQAPAQLRESIRDFFESVVRNNAAYDATARTLLIRYCELLDQLEDVKAQRKEKKINYYFNDKHGQPRIHPLAKHEMQLTNEIGKLFRLLGWDLSPPSQTGFLFEK
jgi:phage terminase small subunit